MSIETYIYFLVVLGGFSVVWSYRKMSQSKNEITDFEYLGFSAFWGTVMVGVYPKLTWYEPKAMETLVSNPFAAGLALFVLGAFFGGLAGYAWVSACRIMR